MSLVKPLYVETSSLLAIIFREPSFETLAKHLETHSAVCTSALTFVECFRGISRALRSGGLLEGDAQNMKGTLAKVACSWNVLQISDCIQRRAGDLFPIEPIRTLDALHLATILEFKEVYPDLLVMSLDQRIIDNLKPLGLERYLGS